MHIGRLLWIAMVASVFICTDGCRKPSADSRKDKPSNVRAEAVIQGEEPPSVLFDIKAASSTPISRDVPLYDCTYQARGKTAKFRLQFKIKQSTAGDLPIGWAEGKFIAVEGSDNSALLEDLQKALEAKHAPGKQARTVELPFEAAVLGQKQSRSDSGAYSSAPAGDWMSIKIFLPKGGDDGEVFLDLNPVLGKAEFSIKDSDYGDYLLEQFAKVL